MTALICICLFVIVYQLIFSIIDDVEHIAYSKSISKFEGNLAFFKSLFWSYLLPKEFLVVSSYYSSYNLNYSISDLANIELVCRNAINNVNGYKVVMKNPSVIHFVEPGNNSSELRLSDMYLSYNSTEKFVLPPYYIRLILKALQNKTTDVLDKL